MAAKTGDFYQWNGSLWSLVSTSFKFRNFPGSKHFFGTGPSNVWAATYQGIYHFDGSGWRNETDSPADAVQLFGDTFGDVWAIRTTGEVMYRDTDTWKSLPAFPLKPSIISGIAFSPDDQWLFDSGVVFRPISSVINGMTRVDYVSFQYILGDLRSVWGSSPNKIWAAGYGGMFKYSGASWKPVDIGIPGGGPPSLEAIFGVGPNDIWAVGTQGTILRYRP
jgi:hypothetical protein